MGRRKTPPMVPISEEVLQHIAKIIGPQSAAQNALDDAAKRRARGEDVKFFTCGTMTIVMGGKPPVCENK